MPTLIQRVQSLVKRTGNGAEGGARHGKVRALMTRGNEVLNPPIWSSTRSFDARQLAQIIQYGYVGLDDTTLAEAVSASAVAYRCAQYRADTTASMTLYVEDSRGDRVETSPLDYVLNESADLLTKASLSLLVFGRAFFRKRYNVHQYPTGLDWINPLDVMEIENARVVTGYRVREAGWNWVDLPPEQVVDLRMFDFDPDGAGQSLVELAFRQIGLDQSMLLSSAGFFVNGMQLGGFLFLPEGLTDDQFSAAVRDFQTNASGASNAHKVSVMRSGQASWVAAQPPPKDLAMRELGERNDDKIAAIFGVDLALLGLKAQSDPLGAGSTYSAKEVNHLRNVTVPFLRGTILAQLNEQWVTDFRDSYGRAYRVEVDANKHPALAEAALTLTSTAGAVTGANLADYDEGRNLLQLEPRAADYFKRAISETLSAAQTPLIGLNEARRLTGREPLSVIPTDDDLILVQGTLVPVSRLMELAQANVEKLKAPPPTSPFGGLSQNGTGVPPIADEPEVREDETDTSFWIGIPFYNSTDLIVEQAAVKRVCKDLRVEWADPDDFHVTLIYAPRAEQEQVDAALAAIRAIPAPSFDVRVGSLNYFDTPDGYDIHFGVKSSAPLREYQAALYEACKTAGLALSSYSDPSLYKPHITMGYSQDKPERKTWASKYRLSCDGIVCCHGDHNVIYETGDGAVEDVSPMVEAPVPAPVTRAAQSTIALTVPLYENALIRAARRELSTYLTDCGETRTTWYGENWSLTLASVNGTKSDASRFIRTCDYEDTRKADAMTAGYNWIAGRAGMKVIGLTVEPSPALNALQRAAAMDMDGYALAPLSIPLVEVPDDCDIDLSAAPNAQYPLVASSVTLMLDSEALHEWTLKGVTVEARDELGAWRRVAEKSRERGITFEPRALRSSPRVALFIRMALENEDADAADVFDHAAEMLRAYRDTRSAFTARIEELLGQAVRGEITRQAFGSRMRSSLTRAGTQTVYDAFDDAENPIESIDPDTLTLFRAWEREQSEYVSGITAEIYKEEGGLTEAGVSTRAGLWASKSLDDLYYEMLRRAAPDKLVTWVRDPLKESCTDCLERDGVSLLLDEWGKLGFPRNPKLECGGWACGCSLIGENGKVYRAFRDEPEPDYSPLHDHTHEEDAL